MCFSIKTVELRRFLRNRNYDLSLFAIGGKNSVTVSFCQSGQELVILYDIRVGQSLKYGALQLEDDNVQMQEPECLPQPILTQRIVRQRYENSAAVHGQQWRRYAQDTRWTRKPKNS